ncbi:MAG: hypothetical protein KatS3mg108_0637 [Isosphaeraceae bacterium]|jgi:Tol biopolymer transport system component|nr:MAG: hypothetical protein KatS3mg108_0637 [Isosphaeraceae bacterium]
MLALLVALWVASDDPVSFRSDVAPILVRRCLGCHDDRKAEAGLNLSTFAHLKRGGRDLGAGILEPGDPDASHLIAVIRPDAVPRMPYKQAPLTDDEIRTLERWVAQGARFDGPSETETPLIALVDPLSLLPPKDPAPGAVEPVTALTFTADGSKLLAARGTEILVLDLASLDVTTRLTGHDGPIAGLHLAPDGRTLIATGGRAGQYGAIAIWDLVRGERLHAWRAHSDTILDSALSPDGQTLATSSYDRLIKLWNVADGQERRTLKEHTDAVYGVAFSPDGTRVASAAGDRTLKLWNVADGRRLVSLSDATAELYAVAFSADGSTVYAAGVDRTLRAWRITGESAVLSLSVFAHDGPIIRLRQSPDGSVLASASEDRTVKFWDPSTLQSRLVLPAQPDWPLALSFSPDGARVALGLYNGRVTVHAVADGARLAEGPSRPRTASTAAGSSAKPELVRGATLDPPTPRGVTRGSTARIRLTGRGVDQAQAIWFSSPALNARLIPLDSPQPNAIDVELNLPPDLPPGVYSFKVRTPLGTAGPRLLAVSAVPETAGREPDDDPTAADLAAPPLPTTWTGTIDKPGDRDHLLVRLEAGQPFVAVLLARELGSSIAAELALMDSSGTLLARATRTDEGREPLLHYTPDQSGPAILRIADTDLGGSGNHFYRVTLGPLAWVRTVSPRGVVPGTTVHLTLTGDNLGDPCPSLSVPADAQPGTLLPLPPLGPNELPTTKPWHVVVATGPQQLATEPDDNPSQAPTLATPGGLSGVIDAPGDVDHAAFEAQAGERWIVEVYGRRLGSPIDPRIEIQWPDGQPVPRAILRPVRETTVAFRDHPSTGRNIRLTWPWTGFNQGDYLLLGRELIRLHELPRNPDDDAVLWGLGPPRNNTGQRVAALETTPEHHPMGQPIYKVELHPPGVSLPPGGIAPVTLYYRNDDGGPGFDKDARLTFDAPEAGRYIVRIEDSRGHGSSQHGYHLVVRPARPDFRVAPEIEDVNIARGSATVVPVSLTRIDGFDGPVDVWVEGLPPGITATPARIEAEQFTADLLFEAAEDAPPFPEGNWILVARSVATDSAWPDMEHRVDPGGPDRGWITVTPPPNLRLQFAPESLEIRPGEEVTMTLAVERRNGFEGRVPIEVRNLPFGVRVLDIGLNGVLITEQQTERVIRLYAEPWVKPQQRPFYAVATCEPAGTTHPARPIRLTVLP